MQEDGIPIFIMLVVSAAIIGVFIIVAVILGAVLMSAF